MDLEILSILAFFGILGAIIIIDRKNIEFGLMLIRRTQKGKKKIKAFALKHKKFFNIFANIGVLVAILLSIFGFVYLFRGTGVRLILPKVFPGEVSEGVQRVVFFMPLWYWVIGLFIIIIPHELFHGFLFALEKIKIKSVGFFLFLIFPGGFVEPDEEQFANSKPVKRMRIAAVGSIANVCVFSLLIILTGLFTRIFYEGVGIQVYAIENEDYPANQINLTGVITEINGIKIRNLDQFQNFLDTTQPGDEIRIKTLEKTYNLTLIEHPSEPGKGFMGISIIPPTFLNKIFGGDPNIHYEIRENFPDYLESIISWFNGLINWVGIISISVAVANLLPFLPFDGGIIWQAIFEKITKNKKLSKKMIIGLSAITYTLLVLSFVDIAGLLGKLGLL
ncbi:MAG: hypothetical protein GF368_04445 [Candidatus Aenigmarchaeota archaeon]|nr:hypothetical protein [Candidatus Aenigmarchaeota archaeon]